MSFTPRLKRNTPKTAAMQEEGNEGNPYSGHFNFGADEDEAVDLDVSKKRELRGLGPLLKSKQSVIVLDGGLKAEVKKRSAEKEDDFWEDKFLNDQKTQDIIKEIHKDYL